MICNQCGKTLPELYLVFTNDYYCLSTVVCDNPECPSYGLHQIPTSEINKMKQGTNDKRS